MGFPIGNATNPNLKSEVRWPLGIARRWPVLLPALVVLLIYLPALHYDLVWDDGIFLRDMPTYRDSELWLSALFRPFVLSPNYFRPLALLTFAAELRLGGLNPTLFHLSNLLLHALNATLLTLLAIQLTSKRANAQTSQRPDALALGGGLLYGLHPALVEGVAFISSRFDLLTTTFLLLALLADVTLRGRRARPILVGLAFLLAALSKEMALAFVLVLPLWHLAREGGQIINLPYLWKRSQESGDLLVYVAVSVAGLLSATSAWATCWPPLPETHCPLARCCNTFC